MNHYALSEPAYIVILHTTLGSYEGAISHLQKRGNPSAHFVCDRTGQGAQLVPLNRGAWHAGVVSSPSARAKRVCRKTLWGSVKNPNKYSFGIENAAGWDIDRDGVIESWEKLFTPAMIHFNAEIILFIEKEMDIVIPDSHILTHKDITSYKPDLELQRSMVIAELANLRNPILRMAPTQDKVFLRNGDKVRGQVENKSIKLTKI